MNRFFTLENQLSKTKKINFHEQEIILFTCACIDCNFH